jgi:hypothetical protein
MNEKLKGFVIYAGAIGAIAFLTPLSIGYFWFKHIDAYVLVMSALAGAVVLYLLLQAKINRLLIDHKIDEAFVVSRQQPEKAKPSWDVARITLEAYFNRNLNQIAWIFWLSLLVMLAGFAVILWGIQQGITIAESKENFTSVKSLPPAIAALSGIITEFIGASFLFIYRSTMQQANRFLRTLERINSVGMAMQILDTMPDEAKTEDLKSQTKAELIKLLVKGVNAQNEGEQILNDREN